ncbi:DUF222 domain-containing protein [Sinomonas sp. P47F7]|uniref:HNH endonuclease signature motif containing protein n=1 Tax=Sinomonas sp. P47F7 TaxID=3410987 RepID=UPI003BF5D052
MAVEAVDETADPWLPSVVFSPETESPFAGELRVPVASFLDASRALELAVAADEVIAWVTAMKMRALARVADAIGEEEFGRSEAQPPRFDGEEAHALAVTEVATATSVSEHAAARLLHDAIDLCGPHWETLDALEDAKIGEAHAKVILDAARSVPPDYATSFARLALQRAFTHGGRRRTPGELRSCLRKLRERLHPESIETRKKAAMRERGVWFDAEPDGMCLLTARMPAEAGLAVYSGIDHDARAAAARSGETRTLPELRADSLAERLLFPSHDAGTDAAGSHQATSREAAFTEARPEQPASDEAASGEPAFTEALDLRVPLGPFRPEITVTVPAPLLLGLGGAGGSAGDSAGDSARDLGATHNSGDAGAVLEGYGPIDAPTARYLASLAPAWNRLFVNATTGEALGVGRDAYRPPQALRRYLSYRDGTCRFPGCDRPAQACEPDHTVEWQNGGTTEASNLASLCPRHHALKSIGAWTYSHAAAEDPGYSPDLLEWRSPLGRTYRTEPADRGRLLAPLQVLPDSPWPDDPSLEHDPPPQGNPTPQGDEPPPPF